MPEKTRDITPPKGLSRLAYRFPIWMYRMGLGNLLGNRFLLLTHTGRKSGLPRQTVLEVVRYDQQSGLLIIASGFGRKSDWVLNIQADPNVTVKSRGVQKKALARRLERQEAGDELVDYSQRHPSAMGQLARFMGYRLDGSEEDVRALGELIPMFSLTLLET